MIEFFRNEDTKAAKELKKSFVPEIKVYLQFIRVFMNEVNHVSTAFERNEALVFKIEEQITKIFNQVMNLILTDNLRKTNIEEKLKLCQKKEKKKQMKEESEESEKGNKSSNDSKANDKIVVEEQNLSEKKVE